MNIDPNQKSDFTLWHRVMIVVLAFCIVVVSQRTFWIMERLDKIEAEARK